MLFTFKVIEDIEIVAFELELYLRVGEEYDFEIGYQDLNTNEEMAVIKIPEKGTNRSISIAVPHKKGVLIRK